MAICWGWFSWGQVVERNVEVEGVLVELQQLLLRALGFLLLCLEVRQIEKLIRRL